ncbi:putative peptidoglycan-binding domain 1 protein [Phaeoacremonium minimum UCRPA7]|uniref:Putative peptidoglycan-binding domain 1 protein n=1 Tax=Phaeoacremonium minimum (strain UCR-PA7) TaxID=1286976 RepID=R8BG63_PHAM7|nr:putative peptidoglycan-binding domain 1 protein [Phaeoacremonium minimum UCRPA7]EON98285.1 putative peptidoglycan-binding domain 1 protein [Phaeoacremonium minimum UCRPA7]
MHFSLFTITLALAGTTLASPALLPRADGYCNTDKVVTGVGGYTIHYPALSSGGSCIMNKGAEGKGVKDLQTSLNHCYGKSLSVDGDYGDKTKAAVLAAQKSIGQGLSKDGIWGPATGSKMNWWGSKKVAQGTETAYSCIKAIL